MPIRGALLLLAAVTCLSCTERAAGVPDLVLQTYSVPTEKARDLRNALNQAFGNFVMPGAKEGASPANELPPTGRASLATDGRLIVLASEKVQQGVRRIVDDLAWIIHAPGELLHALS